MGWFLIGKENFDLVELKLAAILELQLQLKTFRSKSSG